MARTLYHLENCPGCEKVRLALALEKLEFTSHLVDPDDREPVRLISGQTQVPVLVEENGKVVLESNRILKYLARREDAGLLPRGRRDQELTWILIGHTDNVLGPICKSLKTRKSPDGENLGEDDLAVIERRLEHELGVLEGMLERGPFLFGERPTIADIGMHAHLNRLDHVRGLTIPDDLVRVSGWYYRVQSMGNPERAKRI